MDSLEINEDAPKYAAKVINRRPIITLDDSDDGSCSETPETFKRKHMQEEVGRLRKKVPQYQVPSAPCDSHYNTITSTSFDMTNSQC